MGDEQTRLSGVQRQVLQVIHDAFRESDAWPTYQYVDKTLDRIGIQLVDVLPTIPAGLIYPDSTTFRDRPVPRQDETLRLTISGLVTYGGWLELNLFLRVLRYIVERERDFRPRSPNVAEDITVTSEELAREIDPSGQTVTVRELKRMRTLLETERGIWSSFGASPNGGWSLVIAVPGIRQYRNVFTIDQYIEHVVAPTSRPREILVSPPATTAHEAEGSARTIFIVHGQDEARRQEVQGFLASESSARILVLHEQPNLGRTVLEKFEDYAATATYAVVLLTADDLGGAKHGGEQQLRGRQNVLFELGFFFGKLGRRRVAVLYEEGVERPSDLEGLVYISLAGAWQNDLRRELAAAGSLDSDG